MTNATNTNPKTETYRTCQALTVVEHTRIPGVDAQCFDHAARVEFALNGFPLCNQRVA